MEDFKDRILGAMNSTNKVVKEAKSQTNKQSMVIAPISPMNLNEEDNDDHEAFSE